MQPKGKLPRSLASALARHFEAAGMPLEAARYRLEAGRWAAKLAAYEEAIAHLERGLALLEGVPASRERLRLELRLCMAMGTPAMLQRGWQAPAYTRALERLSDLTQHPDLQDDPQRLTALSVLALSTGWSADPERSGRVGEQLLDWPRGRPRTATSRPSCWGTGRWASATGCGDSLSPRANTWPALWPCTTRKPTVPWAGWWQRTRA